MRHFYFYLNSNYAPSLFYFNFITGVLCQMDSDVEMFLIVPDSRVKRPGYLQDAALLIFLLNVRILLNTREILVLKVIALKLW